MLVTNNVFFCVCVYVIIIKQIPNGLGSLSGLVQLILFAAFYRTTNWDEDEKEVELSTSKSNKSDVW